MPRETITIVWPTARIIGTEYWRRMLSRLLVVKKSSVAIAKNATSTSSIISAPPRPPTTPREPRRRGRGAEARAPAVAASGMQDASRRGHDLLLGSAAGPARRRSRRRPSRAGGRRAPAPRASPRSGTGRRRPRRRGGARARKTSSLAPTSIPLRRVVEQQDARARARPAGEHDLLLVAARQRRDGDVDRRRSRIARSSTWRLASARSAPKFISGPLNTLSSAASVMLEATLIFGTRPPWRSSPT